MVFIIYLSLVHKKGLKPYHEIQSSSPILLNVFYIIFVVYIISTLFKIISLIEIIWVKMKEKNH